MTANKDTSIYLDRATLALKGSRYEEAEKIYLEMAEKEYSVEAWCGVGLCKLYQLANGIGVDEALFCFNKAKEIDAKMSDEIDSQFIMHSSNVIITFTKHLHSAIDSAQDQKGKVAMGALLAGASIIAGSRSSSSTFTQLGSLAAGGAGVGIAVDGFNKIEDLTQLQNKIAGMIDELISCVRNNTKSDLKEHQEFIDLTNGLVQSISEKTTTIKNKEAANVKANTIIWLGWCGYHKWKEGDTKGAISLLISGVMFGWAKDIYLALSGKYIPFENSMYESLPSYGQSIVDKIDGFIPEGMKKTA